MCHAVELSSWLRGCVRVYAVHLLLPSLVGSTMSSPPRKKCKLGEESKKKTEGCCSNCKGRPKDLAWAEYSDSRRQRASGDKCEECASLWKTAFIYLTWAEFTALGTNEETLSNSVG